MRRNTCGVRALSVHVRARAWCQLAQLTRRRLWCTYRCCLSHPCSTCSWCHAAACICRSRTGHAVLGAVAEHAVVATAASVACATGRAAAGHAGTSISRCAAAASCAAASCAERCERAVTGERAGSSRRPGTGRATAAARFARVAPDRTAGRSVERARAEHQPDGDDHDRANHDQLLLSLSNRPTPRRATSDSLQQVWKPPESALITAAYGGSARPRLALARPRKMRYHHLRDEQ